MSWYAVRSVYLFGMKADGTNVFEERVVVFEANDWNVALVKAKREGDEYALTCGFERYPAQVGYEQDGEALIDGYELWSELFQASQSLGEFYHSRYISIAHKPEMTSP